MPARLRPNSNRSSCIHSAWVLSAQPTPPGSRLVWPLACAGVEVCGNGWAHKITTDSWADVGHAPSRTSHAVLGFAVHACTHRVEWQHLSVPGYPKDPVGTVDTINFTAYRILGCKSGLQNLDRDQELPLGIPSLADMKSAKPGPWIERTA